MLRTTIALLFALLIAACSEARQDRDWLPYLARTTHVDQQAENFTVAPVLNWSYNAQGPTAQDYTRADFRYSDLRRVWFLIEPQPGMTYAAHTLLLFEFADDRMLGVTIEARREQNEDYNAFAGLGQAYELAYMWGSARDLLTRRVVMLDHEVFVYPIEIRPALADTLLRRLLGRTDYLERTPRWYNTLFSNCTNELAKATDLDWHYSYVLTGYADEHLNRIGLIPGDDFAAAHARSDVTDFVRTLNDAPAAEFDAHLLAELRRRWDRDTPPQNQ
ncbi:MAG: DUF4105 domain-containing protein [Hyphomonadaceae bacterium]